MKKISLVLFAVMMAALLAFGASAEVTNYETDTDASFDVTYTGTAGAYYAIVAVEGIVAEGTAPTITEDNIQFIDQKTAGAGGSVTFEDILLKKDGTACSIFLGGSDLPKAVLLGYVNYSGEFYAVTGKTNAGATVTITDTTDVTVTFTETATSGTYTFAEVPAGTYKLVVTMAKHTSYTKNELVVEDNVNYKDVVIYVGDITGEGSVTFLDFSKLLTVYNQTNEACDVTGDGSVTFLDFSKLLTNYNKTAVVE